MKLKAIKERVVGVRLNEHVKVVPGDYVRMYRPATQELVVQGVVKAIHDGQVEINGTRYDPLAYDVVVLAN